MNTAVKLQIFRKRSYGARICGLYEHAPQMKADGVSDYRQLAAFGDIVLAATYSEKNGFMFCTWKQNADGDSVFWGDLRSMPLI